MTIQKTNCHEEISKKLEIIEKNRGLPEIVGENILGRTYVCFDEVSSFVTIIILAVKSDDNLRHSQIQIKFTDEDHDMIDQVYINELNIVLNLK